MNNLLRWLKSTITLQTSTLMAWLLVAPPILASDGQPGEYLNSTNNQSQQPSYQGYTQTQNSMDCGTYAPPAQSNNYQQQSQQAWTPQPPQFIPEGSTGDCGETECLAKSGLCQRGMRGSACPAFARSSKGPQYGHRSYSKSLVLLRAGNLSPPPPPPSLRRRRGAP